MPLASDDMQGVQTLPSGKPDDAWQGYSPFRGRNYRYAVECSYTQHMAYLKEYPLLEATPGGNGQFGDSRGDRRRRLRQDLFRHKPDPANATCPWPGRTHSRCPTMGQPEGAGVLWRARKDDLRRWQGAEINQKQTKTPTLQYTVRFPVFRRWKRFWKGPQGVVSLVFPDPAGDLFENLDQAHFINYLSHAQAIMLMVNPFMGEAYRETLVRQGKRLPQLDVIGPEIPLNTLINRMRQEANRTRGNCPSSSRSS